MFSSKIVKSENAGPAQSFSLITMEELHAGGPRSEHETHQLKISDARQRADEARERVDTTEREAYEKGFSAGERAGTEFGREKINLSIRRLGDVLEQLQAFKKELYETREKELAELILGIARKVVHAELSVNKDVVINAIHAAVAALTTSENLVMIKLNPEDMKHIVKGRPEMKKYLEEEKGFRLGESAEVGRGGCLIESDHGEVDARLEVAMKAMESAIKGVVAG